MRKSLLLLIALLLCLALIAQAQEARVEKEKDAVRRVVETYLYAEEGEDRKRTISPMAKILSVDPGGSKVIETPTSKSAKNHKGARERSRQKIVSIDMVEGGAFVKVETDVSSDSVKVLKHLHYLSLLKVSGEWKIVGILMPPFRTSGAAG